MAMAQTIQILNRMVEDSVIDRYAIGGAVGQVLPKNWTFRPFAGK